ncbi:MAG TPA: hypothetical protein DCR15_09060 [Arthrobacter bacterium]|nr:hypothetical protein [Arthrobacter sp.]
MLATASACEGTRKDGSACKGQALPSSAFCWAHDPANQGKVAQARSAGGKARSRARRADRLLPATLRPVVAQLLDAIGETHDGTLDARQASAMASLAGALVRVYQAGTLEERVAALEAEQPKGAA